MSMRAATLMLVFVIGCGGGEGRSEAGSSVTTHGTAGQVPDTCQGPTVDFDSTATHPGPPEAAVADEVTTERAGAPEGTELRFDPTELPDGSPSTLEFAVVADGVVVGVARLSETSEGLYGLGSYTSC